MTTELLSSQSVPPVAPIAAPGVGPGRDIILRLHRRGLTLTRISELSGVGRSHLSQLFHGARSGRNTAWRIVSFLLPEEITLLVWEHHRERALKKLGRMTRVNSPPKDFTPDQSAIANRNSEIS